MKNFKIDQLLDKAIEARREEISNKDVELYCPIQTEQIFVQTDQDKLEKVLKQIIDNSIKFTPSGSITISTIIEENKGISSDSQGVEKSVVITVKDTGVGIEPELQNKVFEKAWKRDSSTTQSYSGLGLGLYIARHYLELMGGKITFLSPGLGEGSAVKICLPIFKIESIKL